MKADTWTEPEWMKQYHGQLVDTSGWATPESAMNCDAKNCNLIVNGPRALICHGVSTQVRLLARLHKDGLLKVTRPKPKRRKTREWWIPMDKKGNVCPLFCGLHCPDNSHTRTVRVREVLPKRGAKWKKR